MEEEKKVKTNCSVCKGPVYDNINPQKMITCPKCIQGLLRMTTEEKLKGRDALLEKGDIEGARSIESFINPGKEITGNEPTRNFRPVDPRHALVRKGFMRAVRS